MMRATVLSPRRIWVLLPAVAILGLLLTACGDTRNTTPPPASGATAEASRPGPAATVVPVGAATPSQPVIASGMVDGYMVLAPAVLRSGQTEHISISLFSGNQPAAGDVQLALFREGSLVAEGNTFIEGTGPAPLTVPSLPAGSYVLQVQGPGFKDTTLVQVQDGTVLFLETDKPVYKPGQDVHIRALRLGPELKPLPGQVTVEIQDAKGNKVYRKEALTDDFGMASLTMPLSSEPNLGVWKLTARSGDQTAQTDVRVERYVLPKYEVAVNVPREWVLAGDSVTGSVSAEYSFGKPVRGEVKIVASRYVGQWEEFATFEDEIDGTASFELPPVGYVAGVPASGGSGNLILDVTVREQSTGYVEQTTRLLTVAPSPVNLRLIPESLSFRPTLPFTLLLMTETPDNRPLDRPVTIAIAYLGEGLSRLSDERRQISTVNGKALLSLDPPDDAVAAVLEARSGDSVASLTLDASYSPSDSFIHLEQTGPGLLEVGGQARFRVHSTSPGGNFYYEVISRGTVVFSDFSSSPEISVALTLVMAPTSRLVVYQILPGNEVAADYLPFGVEASYPMPMGLELSADEARPGDSVDIDLTTQGPARVGLAAVDRSVFILAENRLNLRQVFAELDRLYMQPRVERHESWPRMVTTRGAQETFEEAGLVVMSNLDVPEGQEHRRPLPTPALMPTTVPPAAARVQEEGVEETAYFAQQPKGLAEVQRVRQFFPETWIWTDVTTDEEGRATLTADVPDSITTWMLRAVGVSRDHGLGVAEAGLTVFQPFFLQVDLPFSAVRGEELPVKVALYNYLDSTQSFFVELEESDGFDLLDDGTKSVTVGPNDVGGIEFKIRLTELGSLPLKVTARSRDSADAVIKDLLVEPEGVRHETVENRIISAGDSANFDNASQPRAIEGSARTLVALTGSYLSQTLEGLEGLLQMPFGCGEQNMILFAPNVFVSRYLEETGQLKPEVMAKAERLMMTGYQRELIYRRADGSFSAFGDSDESGSLWLTAFVLKTFAQAESFVYIDPQVRRGAAQWVLRHQKGDGSFEPVGFLHNQALLGGLQGNTALTAYVAIALQEAGEGDGAASAIRYLETQLDAIGDAYTMAITAYALALGDSGLSGQANDRLTSMAVREQGGTYWAIEGGAVNNAVETTGYAVLALLERGDRIAASGPARWLVTQRNAFGGFDSTQDTVVGLQALIHFATHSKSQVDMTVTLTSGEWVKTVSINETNADVVQTLVLPVGEPIRLSAQGKGEVVAQVVQRFNRPEVDDQPVEMFRIDVGYSAGRIEVNDRITVTADVRFTPHIDIEAGMVVLDISVPTGFAPAVETIKAAAEGSLKVKRYDIAGRKVVFYVEVMLPGQELKLEFEAVALYPVKAQPVASQVYSYYNPHWRGETLGRSVTVEQN